MSLLTCKSDGQADALVRVVDVGGQVVADVANAPATIGELKAVLETMCGTPAGLQQLLLRECVLGDGATLAPEITELMLVLDESPLYSWDIKNNPDCELLAGGDNDVRYASDLHDYVNVLTREPVRGGVHYFEFVLHVIGDEQWCGVAISRKRAGHCGGNGQGWFYYCGRRYSDSGALHAPREHKKMHAYQHVKDGNVIGMLLDAEGGRLAFALNGKFQGACAVPKRPLYLSTSLDMEEDHVELRRVGLEDAPISLDALRALELEPPAVVTEELDHDTSSCTDTDDDDPSDTE